MSNKVEPKKHHYVPRAYLRFFAKKTDKKKHLIHVKDIKRNKSRIDDVMNVAYNKNFYRINGIEDELIWENNYAEIESDITPLFNTLIHKGTLMMDKSIILTKDLKERLLPIIHSQLFRTEKAMKYFESIAHKIPENTIPNLIKKDPRITPEIAEKLYEVIHDSEYIKSIILLTANMSPNAELRKQLLLERVWILYRNQMVDSIPFVTSDNPVAYYNLSSKEGGFGVNALTNDMSTIFYPINPEFLLVLYPPHCLFGGISQVENQLIFLNEKNVITNYNRIQKQQCEFQIFSKPD